MVRGGAEMGADVSEEVRWEGWGGGDGGGGRSDGCDGGGAMGGKCGLGAGGAKEGVGIESVAGLNGGGYGIG